MDKSSQLKVLAASPSLCPPQIKANFPRASLSEYQFYTNLAFCGKYLCVYEMIILVILMKSTCKDMCKTFLYDNKNKGFDSVSRSRLSTTTDGNCRGQPSTGLNCGVILEETFVTTYRAFSLDT